MEDAALAEHPGDADVIALGLAQALGREAEAGAAVLLAAAGVELLELYEKAGEVPRGRCRCRIRRTIVRYAGGESGCRTVERAVSQ